MCDVFEILVSKGRPQPIHVQGPIGRGGGKKKFVSFLLHTDQIFWGVNKIFRQWGIPPSPLLCTRMPQPHCCVKILSFFCLITSLMCAPEELMLIRERIPSASIGEKSWPLYKQLFIFLFSA